ncbi:MAG: TIGR04283 family arsenosugar biosynthesis glycosyltransferase [Balneolaceae bacterium]
MISIIIPAYNEAKSLPKLIAFLFSLSESKEIEVIISDGGSTDQTVELSKASGAIVVRSPKKGRAAQMNFGASVANGEILYFLHADSYPPATFTKDIEESLSRGYSSGCYRLVFDDPHPLLQFYSWFTKFDLDYFRFGDQSLFIKKELFTSLTGFNEKLLVMEDQMFVKKIKEKADFEILNGEVTTSARKYRQVGVIKLQLIFAIILILFYLGVSQESIIRFYKRTTR